MKRLLAYLFIVLSLGLTFVSNTFSKVVGDKIILGSTISLTGKYSSNGVHTQNGYNMAVDRINSMGGINVGGKSYKFDIIYYDDESNPNRAAQLTKRLIKQDGVQYMLGPYSSGLTKAIAPITEKYKIPMVEANGASRALFTKGYKYLFAVLTTATQYLEIIVDLAVEKNGGKPVNIAMAFEQDAFSQDVRLGVIEAAKRTRSKIIIDDKLPRNLNDMAATLTKVKAIKPDVLIVSGHTKGALTAIRQISEMKVDVPMLAMTHCDANKLSKYFGRNAEYTLCVSQWHKSLIYKDDLFKDGMTYDADFTEIFGYAPPYQAAESSAALLVFKDAFERANSLDKDKVRDALAKTDIETFYGNIKFDSTGKNIAKPMAVFQVRCDSTKCFNKVVAPTKWSSVKLVHPIPKWKNSNERYAAKIEPTGIWNVEPTIKPKKKVKVAKKDEFKPENKDNEAPIIEIAEAITVNDSTYEIDGKVIDKSKKLFVQIDGETIPVKKGKFKIKRFSPIDEQLKIVAIDQWGNKSKPKIVNVTVDIKDTIVADKLEQLNPSLIKSRSNKNRVALIIGIEKYEQTPAANYANLDAQYFYEYARKGFGIPKANIKLLVDEEASLIKSISTINKWLPSKIKDNQTELIIFFAGHGLASNNGEELYILPQDSDPDLLSRTALSRTELFEQIIKLNPKSVTMFMDTCYSGISRDEKMLLASARPIRIVADDQEGIPDNFTIFTASKLDQISSGLKEAEHGIFSYYLMKGLEGKADSNQDKKITNGELLAYMNENVSQKAAELGREQNPSLAGDPDKVLISYK
tara:strand:- start:234 stop:2645 length:2412 start_codon:yes stop_codon:yes gene_type:complete